VVTKRENWWIGAFAQHRGGRTGDSGGGTFGESHLACAPPLTRETAIAALRIRRYDPPVVDVKDVLVGVVTVDDVLDWRKGGDRGHQKLGGMEALDAPYLKSVFFDGEKACGLVVGIIPRRNVDRVGYESFRR